MELSRRSFLAMAGVAALAALAPQAALAASRGKEAAKLGDPVEIGDLKVSFPDGWETAEGKDQVSAAPSDASGAGVSVQMLDLGGQGQSMVDFYALMVLGAFFQVAEEDDESGVSAEMKSLKRGEGKGTVWYSAEAEFTDGKTKSAGAIDMVAAGEAMYMVVAMAPEGDEALQADVTASLASVEVGGEKAPEKMEDWQVDGGQPSGQGGKEKAAPGGDVEFDGSGLEPSGDLGFYISTPGGMSKDGEVPQIVIPPNSVGHGLRAIADGHGGAPLTLYIDGRKKAELSGGRVDADVTFDDADAAPGTHVVEIAREEGGEVTAYDRAEYEVVAG